MIEKIIFNPLFIKICLVWFLLVLLSYYLYYQYCFTYWKRRGIPSIKPRFPAGNITSSILGRENIFILIQNLYNKFKEEGHKHAGIYFFNGPVYLPIDPKIVKSILTEDFQYFADRGMHYDEEKCPVSGHIFSLTGTEWKNLRNQLSPVLTSSKVKSMFSIFKQVAENFIEVLTPIAESSGEVNIKDTAINYTADAVSCIAFGVDCDTLKNPDHALSQIVSKLFHPSPWLFLKMILSEGYQNPGNIMKVFQSNKLVEDFFMQFVKDVIEIYENQDEKPNNFFSVLLKIRDKDGLSFNQVLAHSFFFFVAGLEASSATIAYALHELAHNQEIQQKLRQEIREVLGEDFSQYTFENLNKLQYLDSVFQETLRLYPILGYFNRICVKSYKVPGADLILEKGTPVLIPVLGFQRDPEYFPDPMRFDPERFNSGSPLVPFTFLPFGAGPRYCIGSLFGKFETMLGLAVLVSRFRFLPSAKSPRIVKFDKFSTSPAMSPRGGVTVKIEKLSKQNQNMEMSFN